MIRVQPSTSTLELGSDVLLFDKHAVAKPSQSSPSASESDRGETRWLFSRDLLAKP